MSWVNSIASTPPMENVADMHMDAFDLARACRVVHTVANSRPGKYVHGTYIAACARAYAYLVIATTGHPFRGAQPLQKREACHDTPIESQNQAGLLPAYGLSVKRHISIYHAVSGQNRVRAA